MPKPAEPRPDPGRDEDVERVNRSLEELEDLVDQVILYADPRYIDDSRLESPEGAAFARQCREVADYLSSLAVRLEGMLDKAPHAPQANEANEASGPDAGDAGDR
jgi:hypothetical protein